MNVIINLNIDKITLLQLSNLLDKIIADNNLNADYKITKIN